MAPKEIYECVLINVCKFIILSDFIAIYYLEDDRVPIITGHLFLGNGGGLIDVKEGTLKIRLNNESVIFKVYKALNKTSHCKYLCMIISMDVFKCGVE